MSIPQQYVRERWIAQNESWQQTHIENCFFLQTLRSITIIFVGCKQQNSWRPSLSHPHTVNVQSVFPLLFWILLNELNHDYYKSPTHDVQHTMQTAHLTSHRVAKGLNSEDPNFEPRPNNNLRISTDSLLSLQAYALKLAMTASIHIFSTSFQSYH